MLYTQVRAEPAGGLTVVKVSCGSQARLKVALNAFSSSFQSEIGSESEDTEQRNGL